jgi:hypothetical protein
MQKRAGNTTTTVPVPDHSDLKQVLSPASSGSPGFQETSLRVRASPKCLQNVGELRGIVVSRVRFPLPAPPRRAVRGSQIPGVASLLDPLVPRSLFQKARTPRKDRRTPIPIPARASPPIVRAASIRLEPRERPSRAEKVRFELGLVRDELRVRIEVDRSRALGAQDDQLRGIHVGAPANLYAFLGGSKHPRELHDVCYRRGSRAAPPSPPRRSLRSPACAGGDGHRYGELSRNRRHPGGRLVLPSARLPCDDRPFCEPGPPAEGPWRRR